MKGELGEQTFPLLADMTREVSRSYNALLEEKGFALRATFLIDPNGKLQASEYHNPDLGRNVDEILRRLEGLVLGERCPVNWKPGQKTLGKG